MPGRAVCGPMSVDSLFSIALLCHVASACTVIGVARGATADGSTLVSHSSDAEGAGDPRVVKVTGGEHAEGSRRPIYDFGNATVPMGYLPQVSHTYSFLREQYGMINEKQVTMGETTCNSASPVDAIKPVSRGGGALLSIVSLGELALERCDSARCAVSLMGSLAETYGFYQDAGTPTGEALVVGDPTEVWIFHVLPPLRPDDESGGVGAIWAAARVPDGSVTAVTNAFVIRTVPVEGADGANFLFGSACGAVELGARPMANECRVPRALPAMPVRGPCSTLALPDGACCTRRECVDGSTTHRSTSPHSLPRQARAP